MQVYRQQKTAYGTFVSAYPTFPRKPEYHRTLALSLLCSEREEVGHARIKHRRKKTLCGSLRSYQIEFTPPLGVIFEKVSIGMVGRIISTPWLKSLRTVHLAPINVVVFDEITYTLSWGGLRA